MKLKVSYIDNYIESNNESVAVVEIENRKYFYRLVKDLYSIALGDISDDISFIDNENKEINASNKIKLFIDFFNIELNSKKYLNDLTKYILENINEKNREDIINIHNRLTKVISIELNKIDLPLKISIDSSIDNIIKSMKISITEKDSMLDNLFLIIDLEKILRANKLLCFVNLKQYLSKEEIIELYKYSIYNNVRILLIDSQCYGCKLEYENKLIIDENLGEFML